MEAKGNIRKEVFARRRAATQEEIQEKSRMIYEKITALPEFLDADCFFAYMDFKKEVMTRDLIEKALQMGKTVAVPRVEGDDMVYYEIKDFSTLKSGYFGIMEPDGGKVCTREEGFLLVPGVAFDPARHRVGYGKGFYDELAEILEVDENGVSRDGKILLTTKRCFGRCNKGPNVSIDGEIYSMMTMPELKNRLGLK